ncbi:acyltransferase family protein [Inhella sp.]|uniref:acyltransferase family protein n=1 Tax=Inhella sp. TaxID=1921806 RepID=UPI0035B11A26
MTNKGIGSTNHFTFLRTAAALLVLWSHQHALSGIPESGVLGVHSWGGLGVLIFFTVSGFLVTQSWQSDPHMGRFALRRLLRIWPAFAVAILLSALVLGPALSDLSLRAYFYDHRFTEYLNNLVFRLRGELPLRFEGNALPTAINGSLWTIPLELRCYAILAVVGAMGLLNRRALVLAITLGLALLHAGVQLRGELFTQWVSPKIEELYFVEFGIAFLMGVSVRLYWTELAPRMHWVLLATLVLGGGSWWLGRPVLSMLLVVPVATLMFATRSWLGLRDMDRVGDFSYGIYLYAFLVQQLLIWAFRDHLGWWPLLGLTILVTVSLAAASWYGVERPLQRFKPRARRVAVPVPVAPGAGVVPLSP